MIEGDFYF